MIDTDKYEPTRIDWVLHNTREHTSDGWRELSKSLIELSDDDRELIANAPTLRAEVERLREVISRAINTLLPNPPQDLYELTSTTFAQDTGDLIGFYTQAMGHAIGILEGTE